MATVRIGRLLEAAIHDDSLTDQDQIRRALIAGMEIWRLRDDGFKTGIVPLDPPEDRRYHLAVVVSAAISRPHETYVLTRLDERLEDAVTRGIRDAARSAKVEAVAKWVDCPIPFPERLVPGLPNAPNHVAAEAIREMICFTEDRELASRGLEVSIESDGACVRLESGHPRADVAAAAVAFLTATVTEPQRVISPPSKALTSPRVAALITTALAIATIFLSLAPLTWPALAGLICAVPIATVAAVGIARRARWADWRLALIGLTPMLVIVAFAVIYGLIAHSSRSAITHDGRHVNSLGDALLLSINVALSGGIPDLTLTGTVRTVVYIEILLFLGSVGANFAVAGRWAASRLLSAVRPRQMERG